MAGDPTEDIRVGIRGVSWILWAERGPRRSWGCAWGPWFKHNPPPPPTKTGRKLGAADRPVEKEVGWRRRNYGLGDGDKIFMRPAVEALTVRSSISTHRILVRLAIAALTVRSSIGPHRILVRPDIMALTVRPAIAALTGY